jgi:hypothetical protein
MDIDQLFISLTCLTRFILLFQALIGLHLVAAPLKAITGEYAKHVGPGVRLKVIPSSSVVL